MKRVKLERILSKMGLELKRSKKHRIWGNDRGSVAVNNCMEIPSGTVHKALKKAKELTICKEGEL